jgi:hypothetical protein
MTAFVDKVLDLAALEVGVRETSPNRGQRVDEYHRYAGRDPAQADSWCAQFVWWVIGHAAESAGLLPPMRFSSSVHRLWERNAALHVVGDPRPGDVFCADHGDGKGHCGLVVGVGDLMHTIEGNSNLSGSRNGNMVVRRARPFSDATLGFLRPAVDDGPAVA